MIHVATVHYRSDKWIDVQLAYLNRHLHEPYRVVANLEAVPGSHDHKFDRVVPARGPHPGKLNLLAALILGEASPDDLIMFLDGDAFPIVDPMPLVRGALDESVLVAVLRAENSADRQPHPCFCAIRAADWDGLRGDWSAGHCWQDSHGEVITDTGGNLLVCLERSKQAWTPLTRSNRFNPHPLWFAVYGGIVYHHGAGFRDPMARSIVAEGPQWFDGIDRHRLLGAAMRRADSAQKKIWSYRQMMANRRLGEEMFAKLARDPMFYLELTQGESHSRQ